MSAILKFDFQKREQLRFSEVNYLNYTKKTQFCMATTFFPKTKGNKNKPWTHSTRFDCIDAIQIGFGDTQGMVRESRVNSSSMLQIQSYLKKTNKNIPHLHFHCLTL